MKHSTQKGFSLVEVMVAIAIGLAMTGIIVNIYSRSSKTAGVTQTLSEIQEQAEVALDTLERDIRMAGYLGCNSNLVRGIAPITTLNNPADYLNNFQQFIVGYDGTGASFSPAAPSEVTGGTPNASAANDAFTVRIPVGEPQALSATMAGVLAPIPLFSVAGFSAGTRAVVSDCTQASIFAVSGLAGTTLQHAGGLNSTADLQRRFGSDAVVVPFQTVSYYLAPGTSGGGLTSLWRRVNLAANSEEVAEGIEQFHVQYGVDTDAAIGGRAANLFLTADNVADWSQVVSVRISLLMRSKSSNAAQGAQSYAFNGVPAITAGDQRLRRPFNVTVHLRNRTL
jgi:type IV pilus assembly protein PilW